MGIAIKWIDGQMRGDCCKVVGLRGCTETGGPRRGRPNVAPSPDID
jgi:hypothetical protein